MGEHVFKSGYSIEKIENNDFAVVDELPFSITPDSDIGSFRPDINIKINQFSII